ncbi:MAG: hypothetical protein JST47_07120 [Bacteroidetes bacterium]|nr:hypothetical protein [Bacteroidota bacterium]
MPNGIPFHVTINQLFAALNPASQQGVFLQWAQYVAAL